MLLEDLLLDAKPNPTWRWVGLGSEWSAYWVIGKPWVGLTVGPPHGIVLGSSDMEGDRVNCN